MRRQPKHAAPAAPHRVAAAPAVPRPARRPRPQQRRARLTWRSWWGSRPWRGALLAAAAGVELLLTGGMWRGLTSSAAEALVACCLLAAAVLLCAHPVWRSGYATAAVLVAVAALMVDHIGGYLGGSALGAIGGAIAFAWVPVRQPDNSGQSEEATGGVPAGNPAVAVSQRAAGQQPAGTAGRVPALISGQAPELMLIMGDGAKAAPSPPAAQRPPTSALRLDASGDD